MNSSRPKPDGVEFEVNRLYEVLQKVSDKRKARGKRYRVALGLALSVVAK